MTQPSLFAVARRELALDDGARLLPGFAGADEAAHLLEAIAGISAASPFRTMFTPGGRALSVETTSCGVLGWLSDHQGYRYGDSDPLTARAWPAIPRVFEDLAGRAARHSGFPYFKPDSCLINRYRPGAKMTLHQDRKERDFGAPIVSVSLGLSATFLFGGFERLDPTRRVPLHHGDVVVWGGPSRLRFHGVLPVAPGDHPIAGSFRYNLTFRLSG
jgi:alkylated DNA repair protein (DNA oxidative demethylase)